MQPRVPWPLPTFNDAPYRRSGGKRRAVRSKRALRSCSFYRFGGHTGARTFSSRNFHGSACTVHFGSGYSITLSSLVFACSAKFRIVSVLSSQFSKVLIDLCVPQTLRIVQGKYTRLNIVVQPHNTRFRAPIYCPQKITITHNLCTARPAFSFFNNLNRTICWPPTACWPINRFACRS